MITFKFHGCPIQKARKITDKVIPRKMRRVRAIVFYKKLTRIYHEKWIATLLRWNILSGNLPSNCPSKLFGVYRVVDPANF